MSLSDLRRWLRRARKRYWEAVHQRELAPPNDKDRETLVGEVRRRREVKERLVDRVKRRVRRRKRRKQGDDEIKFSAGAPHWGGCEDVIVAEIVPVADDRGVGETSGKRSETFGNPTSDHHISQVLASARDFAIANGYSLADAIGYALGIGPVDDYTAYYITREGVRIRVQIIAGTHGTGPHLHTGLRRA